MTKKQMEYFIITDSHHLLRTDESYIGYELKRLFFRIKKFIKG